jgi:hypothetical protein
MLRAPASPVTPMSQNPYSPPRVERLDLPQSSSSPSRKHVAAWLMRALGVTGAVVTALTTANGLSTMDRLHMGGAAGTPWMAGMTTSVLLQAALYWYMVVGVQERSAAGRWAGVLALVLLSAFWCVGLGIGALRHGMPAPAAMATVGALALVVVALNAWWIHAFAFSSRARSWFGVSRRAD